MLFNSFGFVVLALCIFFLYYLPALRKWQIPILILGSFAFYAYDRAGLLIPLSISIGINITVSYLVYFGNARYRKLLAAGGVAINLGILTYFKYWGRMPLGLSFITFQQISLLIDTLHSERIDGCRKLIEESKLKHSLNVTLLVAFFPKLTAGPIMKARDFLPQIGIKLIRDIDWNHTMRALVVGYFLKMVVADNLKDFTFWITYPHFLGKSTITLLSLTFGYSMQLFADFAGYSLIAIGIASLFGYRLVNNFNFPYISKSFSEFWTRWHISLSSFLKEYLYIPLGGNRNGRARTYVNLLIVMFLGGLWHGATWNFGIWGLSHGMFLALERFFGRRDRISSGLISSIFRILLVFIAVNFAWLFFTLTEFSHTVKYFGAIFRNGSIPTDFASVAYIFIYSFPVIAYHLYYLCRQKSTITIKCIEKLEHVAYGIMLFLILTNSGSPNKFVYFQF